MQGRPVVERLTDHAVALHEARTFEQLSGIVVDALGELVPCDWATLSFMPSIGPSPTSPRLWVSRADADWESALQRTESNYEDDPVYSGRLRLQVNSAAVYSGVRAGAAFTNSRLYNEAWRPLRARQLLAFYSPGCMAYDVLCGRSGGRKFTEQEREVVHTLGRHVDAATTRLVNAGSGTLSLRGDQVRVSTARWLVCDRAGKILRAMSDARTWMHRCTSGDAPGGDAPGACIPAAWLAALQHRLQGRPVEPLRYRSDGHSIAVYLAPIRGTPDECTAYIVVDRLPADPLAGLLALGLTRREADVLHWASEGKTGPEIGIILGISALTAKKHMENVLAKLDVTSRAAAVNIAARAAMGR